MKQTMHTIHLHGSLAEFGTSYHLAVNTPLEAIRALSSQISGFGDAMRSGMFRLVRGTNPDTGMHYEVPYDEDTNTYNAQMLFFSLGEAGADFHIVPAVAGAGSGGGGKIIFGAIIMTAALIGGFISGGATWAGFGAGLSNMAVGSAAGFGISFGAIAMFGGALTLAGIA